MLMNPSRHFAPGDSSEIDFGVASIFAGLTSLAVRVVFALDLPVPAWGGGELTRVWTSQWGSTAANKAWYLGQAPGDPLGSIRFSVADGGGSNLATVVSSVFLSPIGNANRQWHEIVANWSASGAMAIYFDGFQIASVSNQTAVTAIGAAATPTSHLTIGAQPGFTGWLAPAIQIKDVGYWSAPLGASPVPPSPYSTPDVQAMAASSNPSRMYSPLAFLGSCEMNAPGAGPESLLSYGCGNLALPLNLSGTVTGTWVESHNM